MIGESLGLPLPSEVLLPFLGWLVFSRRLSYLEALGLAVAAQMIGSYIGYAIGVFGGRPAFRWLEGVTGRHELDLAERWFDRHGAAAVFWGRFLPVVRTFISWPAGIGRMGLGRFTLFTFLGSIPWTAALIYAGSRLGGAWSSVGSPFQKVSLVLGVLLVLTVAWWVLSQFRSPRRPAKS